MELKTELEPFTPLAVDVEPAPPAPIVIVYAVPITTESPVAVNKPPAPPPPAWA
jgi:hypothetical protein